MIVQEENERMMFCECQEPGEDLHQLVKSFFTTEHFGVQPPSKCLESEAIGRANEIIEKTMKSSDGQYGIGLLWRTDNEELPNNFPMAMRRLLCEEAKMKRDSEYAEWINGKIQEMLAKGYARLAQNEELEADYKRIWYLPIFSVVNANKIPIKRRLILDAKAKYQGKSLNDCLLKGPDQLASLPGILIRSREHKIVAGGDVREMFHRIRIIKEDQQCQRFLWRNGDQTKKPKTFILQAMAFGPTCSPACAQSVKNTHARKYRKNCPEAVEAIERDQYVDDLLRSFRSEVMRFEL